MSRVDHFFASLVMRHTTFLPLLLLNVCGASQLQLLKCLWPTAKEDSLGKGIKGKLKNQLRGARSQGLLWLSPPGGRDPGA
uniref:Uncharacterized protein n=1 Tax=Rhipicephalus appendiculatus TaxID=34631 RepID=A0A131YCS2_RHIAP